MIKIEKHDIKKLEEYIQHIDNYRRELKMREYGILKVMNQIMQELAK
ncbi:phage transcriptional regulator [Staphylococcus aureus]|uniref:Phage transcriptional regulator n=1 Tax=Staphylococcus aureus TaxID=1280 RepID=A0A380ELM7_STAAU|nr:phage transcriptional regulator [Staphylococcus aureus]